MCFFVVRWRIFALFRGIARLLEAVEQWTSIY